MRKIKKVKNKNSPKTDKAFAIWKSAGTGTTTCKKQKQTAASQCRQSLWVLIFEKIL